MAQRRAVTLRITQRAEAMPSPPVEPARASRRRRSTRARSLALTPGTTKRPSCTRLRRAPRPQPARAACGRCRGRRRRRRASAGSGGTRSPCTNPARVQPRHLAAERDAAGRACRAAPRDRPRARRASDGEQILAPCVGGDEQPRPGARARRAGRPGPRSRRRSSARAHREGARARAARPGARIALHEHDAVRGLERWLRAWRERRPAAARGGGQARAHVERSVGARASPAIRPRSTRTYRHAASTCGAPSRAPSSAVIVCMQTRPIGHSRRKHGAQGAHALRPPAAPSRTARSGRRWSPPTATPPALPIAAARCSAPESGPNASAQRAEHRDSWRSDVRPTRSRTGAARRARHRRRRTRRRRPCRGGSRRLAAGARRARSSTAAVRSGNQRRAGHDEPTQAATTGRGSPASSASACCGLLGRRRRARTRPAPAGSPSASPKREELLELRPLDALRWQVPRGEQPAALARVGAREAEPDRRAARAGEQRALRAAPEIERDVPAARAQPAHQRRDRAQPRRGAERRAPRRARGALPARAPTAARRPSRCARPADRGGCGPSSGNARTTSPMAPGSTIRTRTAPPSHGRVRGVERRDVVRRGQPTGGVELAERARQPTQVAAAARARPSGARPTRARSKSRTVTLEAARRPARAGSSGSDRRARRPPGACAATTRPAAAASARRRSSSAGPRSASSSRDRSGHLRGDDRAAIGQPPLDARRQHLGRRAHRAGAPRPSPPARGTAAARSRRTSRGRPARANPPRRLQRSTAAQAARQRSRQRGASASRERLAAGRRARAAWRAARRPAPATRSVAHQRAHAAPRRARCSPSGHRHATSRTGRGLRLPPLPERACARARRGSPRTPRPPSARGRRAPAHVPGAAARRPPSMTCRSPPRPSRGHACASSAASARLSATERVDGLRRPTRRAPRAALTSSRCPRPALAASPSASAALEHDPAALARREAHRRVPRHEA